MKITLNQIGQAAHFNCTTESGHTLELNSPLQDGEQKQAPSPMEALLMACAGCTSVDIVLIMQKMKQEMTNLQVEVDGQREKIADAKPFRKINLHYIYYGQVEQAKAERATKLSVEKYCSVLESLHPDVEINYSVEIREK